MITVKNLKKVDNIIKCDYCYLDEDDIGHVEYNIISGEFEQIIYNKRDQESYEKTGRPSYSFKVLKVFKDMIKYDKYPERYDYIWY